jgi:hypothetical protein
MAPQQAVDQRHGSTVQMMSTVAAAAAIPALVPSSAWNIATVMVVHGRCRARRSSQLRGDRHEGQHEAADDAAEHQRHGDAPEGQRRRHAEIDRGLFEARIDLMQDRAAERTENGSFRTM